MSKGSKIHDITGEQLFNGLLLATLGRCSLELVMVVDETRKEVVNVRP
jgi:hypothetical protein